MLPAPDTCPTWFPPQHLTPPSAVSAQVWLPPATIAATPLVSPATSVGAGTGVLLPDAPLPTCPLRLPPQHFTPPPVVSAQVCPVPAVIATTPFARPAT